MAISNNKRDLSKLVKVQRAVTRGGKTFIQNFYVNPSQVKATDRVIGGQQNLLPKPPTPTPSSSSATLDVAYFDSLAQTDRSKALDYLKSCGITWKENAHAGINWMRAKQAMKASQGISNTTNKVANSSNQNQSSGLNQQKDAINADLSKATSSKEKVSILKKHLGVSGCTQLAESLGVTWKKDSHEAINWMRASMALKKYIEAGGDLKLGDTSALTSNAGANTTIKKDKVVDKPKEDDKLKIDKNATERQKNIINLLNNISDPELLKSYTTVGMIAEDDVSKDFILKKLLPKYNVFLKSQGAGNQSSKEFAETIFKGLKLSGCFDSKADAIRGLKRIFGEVNIENFINPENYIEPFESFGQIKIDGASESITKYSPEKMLKEFDSYYTRYKTDEYPNGYDGSDSKIYESLYNVEKEGIVLGLRKLQQSQPELSKTCDDMAKKYDETMKMCRCNPKILRAVLSTESYGKELPKPTDKDSDIIAGKMWKNFFRPFIRNVSYNNFVGVSLNEGIAHTKGMFKELDSGYESLLNEFRKQGMDDESIFVTLYSTQNTFFPQNLKFDAFPIYDRHGYDTGKTLSLSKDLYKFESDMLGCMDTNFIGYFCAKFATENNIDTKDFDANLDAYESMSLFRYMKTSSPKYMGAINSYKQYGDFSKEDYAKIHSNMCDMFGISFKKRGDASGESVKIKDMDLDNLLENMSGDNSLYEVVPTKDDDKKAVLTNLTHMLNVTLTNRIADNPIVTDYTLETAKKLLDTLPTYSKDDIQKMKNYFSKDYNPNVGVTLSSEDSDIQDLASDNPLKKIVYDYTKCLAINSKNLLNKKSKESVDKLWDKFFDLSAMSDVRQEKKIDIKKLRQQAFDAVHCTISTESESESEKLRKEFLDDWDYKDGVPQTTPDGATGKTHTARVYSGKNSFQGKDRRALFNSRFFKVNNSNMEENFNDYQKKLKSDGSPKESEVLNLYHACSYAATAGILGKTGGWFMGNEFTKTAKALGTGAYFGYKGGKSAVYCGEGSGGYHNLKSTGNVGDNANGCYIMASVMRGKNNKDSASDHGRFKDYELVVKNNACIKPNYFVDISSRAIGVNVSRDSNGNYLNSSGKITHDKTGKAVNMK